MRILTRYLLRAHLGPFLFALSVLTGLLFVNTIARRFEDLAGKGLPLSVILEFLYLSLPHIVALTLPMAVLVATLYAFSQLTAENEVTAMKASGVNMLRVLAPLVVVATLIAGGMVWFNDRVLPETNHRLKLLLMDVARKNPTLTFRERTINPIQSLNMRTRYYLEPGSIDRATGLMQDVVIYDLSDPQRARTVYADSGRIAFNASETNLFLGLYDGYITEVDEQRPENFARVFFDEQFIELREIGAEFERGGMEVQRGDREMSLAMLREVIDTTILQLAALRGEAVRHAEIAVRRALDGPGAAPQIGAPPPSMARATPLRAVGMAGRGAEQADEVVRFAQSELQLLANRAELLEFRRNSYAVEWHKKFAIPFACIVFVLIGAPLAVRFPRGGPGMVIAVSLAIFGIYYISLIGGETLGDNGTIQPWLGPWGPNLLFSAIAILAVRRLGKEISDIRGGGWDDMWLTIRQLVTRPFRRQA